MTKFKSCEKSGIQVGEGGMVRGYASTFDRIPDCYGDVVAKGAFTETLKKWKELNAQGKYIPLLYAHDTTHPKYNIGRIVDAGEDDIGMWVEGEFDKDNDIAQYVRKLVKEGRLYQFSFAYDAKRCGMVELEDGVKANELQELQLFEVSLVQIPANQLATVEDVKAAKAGKRNSAKDESDIQKAISLIGEAGTILNALLGDGDSGQEGADDEGGEAGGDAGAKGREAEAELLELYKKTVIEFI